MSSAPQNRLEPGSFPPAWKASQSGIVQVLGHRYEHVSSWSARTSPDHRNPVLKIDGIPFRVQVYDTKAHINLIFLHIGIVQSVKTMLWIISTLFHW